MNINKTILFCILFFKGFIFFAQNTSGIIEYSFDMQGTVQYVLKSEKKEQKDLKISDYWKNVYKASKHIVLELTFDKNNAVFKQKGKLRSDNINPIYYRSALTISCRGIYHSNSKNLNNIHEITSSGEALLISDPMTNLKWKYDDDEKNILGFLCKKAVLNKKGRENSSYEVVAWYAPSIPKPFGPKEYGGLQGVILELDVAGNRIYRATKIKLNADVKIDKFSSKGKHITKKEYNERGKMISKNFEENIKN